MRNDVDCVNPAVIDAVNRSVDRGCLAEFVRVGKGAGQGRQGREQPRLEKNGGAWRERELSFGKKEGCGNKNLIETKNIPLRSNHNRTEGNSVSYFCNNSDKNNQRHETVPAVNKGNILNANKEDIFSRKNLGNINNYTSEVSRAQTNLFSGPPSNLAAPANFSLQGKPSTACPPDNRDFQDNYQEINWSSLITQSFPCTNRANSMTNPLFLFDDRLFCMERQDLGIDSKSLEFVNTKKRVELDNRMDAETSSSIVTPLTDEERSQFSNPWAPRTRCNFPARPTEGSIFK